MYRYSSAAAADNDALALEPKETSKKKKKSRPRYYRRYIFQAVEEKKLSREGGGDKERERVYFSQLVPLFRVLYEKSEGRRRERESYIVCITRRKSFLVTSWIFRRGLEREKRSLSSVEQATDSAGSVLYGTYIYTAAGFSSSVADEVYFENAADPDWVNSG